MKVPDNYKNLREIASASQKSLSNWIDKPSGKSAIATFKKSHPDIENPIITKRGKGGGTYAHPELAAIFAAWCDPQFPGFQQKVIEFQRTKIQAMLPFISDTEIQRQMANPMDQRMLSVGNPQTDTEHAIGWLEKYKEDPMAEKLIKRLIEHPAQINPGTCYDKAKWGAKAAFDRACDRWEIFDRIVEMMRGNPYWLKHYGLTRLTPSDLERLIDSIE